MSETFNDLTSQHPCIPAVEYYTILVSTIIAEILLFIFSFLDPFQILIHDQILYKKIASYNSLNLEFPLLQMSI